MKKLSLCFLSFAFSLSAVAATPKLAKIRIGWQVPWAVQGELVQVMKHTDVLKQHGLEAEFIGRTYGPVLNELALAGSVDVILTADQPAAALFAKSDDWVGIGRLMYNRTSTYVPPMSPIHSIKELKGKTIGIPIGAAAERITVKALKKAGLNPKTDVHIVNTGIREQVPLVAGGKTKAKWGNLDALSGFDPTPAVFESHGLVRVLDVGKVCALVVMNKTLTKKHPEVAIHFMEALRDAYDYYRQHPAQADEWFMKEAHIPNDDRKACTIAASLEPNLKAKSRRDIRVTFSRADLAILQEAADFLAPKLGKHVQMKDHVTNDYARRAD